MHSRKVTACCTDEKAAVTFRLGFNDLTAKNGLIALEIAKVRFLSTFRDSINNVKSVFKNN
jgi:hypothetical protein